MKTVKVADLKDQTSTSEPRPLLHCPACGEDFSAHKGDYFLLPENHVFRHCGRPLVLATKHTFYQP